MNLPSLPVNNLWLFKNCGNIHFIVLIDRMSNVNDFFAMEKILGKIIDKYK